MIRAAPSIENLEKRGKAYMTQLGPEHLFRAIFRDKPADTPIYTTITQNGGTTLSLRDALNEALDTLRLTKGNNDRRPWARWKIVLDKSYGLNGIRFKPKEIVAQWPTIPLRSVSAIKREALRELRRNEGVIQMLSAFFVPTPT